MPFAETTHLLRNEETYTSSRKVAKFFKKYLLPPLSLFLSLLLVYAIVQPDAYQTPILESSPIYIPPIVPISEIIANGTVKVERFSLVITEGKTTTGNKVVTVHLVNGKFPGPAIRVQQGSILIVTVKNHLKIPVAIHFHGLHQRGTFLSDGVPLITQDPIPPGGTFTHTINTWPQTGTFFYHAHTGMDIVWISGPLIIEDDEKLYKSWPSAYQYDEERTFLINGVYDISLDEVVTRVAGPVYSYPRVDTVVINGKGHGIDPIVPLEPWEEVVETIPKVIPKRLNVDETTLVANQRYRFRVISSISDGAFNCTLPGHNFTVIEMDGVYTEPVETDNFVISPGQRYSFIVTANAKVENYFLICKHLEIGGPTGLSILRYAGAPNVTKEDEVGYVVKVLNTTVTESVNDTSKELKWILDELNPNHALNQVDVYPVPQKVDREFYIDVAEVENGTKNIYLLNGHYFEEPSVYYAKQLSQSINITDPPQVFEVLEGEVIQIILQNQRLYAICFGHPWHLHGHSFYVVGHGPDKYDPVRDHALIEDNVKRMRKMQFRDTVMVNGDETVPPDGNPGPKHCGWTAIRFVANNPGVWLSHCHVTPHMLMGKRFVIWEHSLEDPFFETLSRNQLPN